MVIPVTDCGDNDRRQPYPGDVRRRVELAFPASLHCGYLRRREYVIQQNGGGTERDRLFPQVGK